MEVKVAGAGIDVHMIGFAKVVGDIADGALSVVTFAIVTVALTLLFVWIYIQSLRIALVPVISSLVAMVWHARACWCYSATAWTRLASSFLSLFLRSERATACRRSAP